jgi:VWFA-related protein
MVDTRLLLSMFLVLATNVTVAHVSPYGQVLAQSLNQEKPRLKEFGTSLKRLKWDSAKQAAVEIGAQNHSLSPATGDDVIRVETRLVVAAVLVTDEHGRGVEGLRQDDFIILEDDEPQKISHFSLGDDVSVERTIVLIIDYSPSQFPYINTSLEAAKLLVSKLGPKDRMAIVTAEIKLLVDFTRNKDELKNGLESLKKRLAAGKTGGSSQFSALMATVREMFSVEDTRPIVIFQTDGDEWQFLQPASVVAKIPELKHRVREYGINDISNAAERSRATVYSVVSGIRVLGLPPAEQLKRERIIMENGLNAGYQLEGTRPPRTPKFPEGLIAHNAEAQARVQSAMAHVAEVTGGWAAYLEQPDEAAGIYSRILSDVNSRYVIGFYPADKSHDGKRHRVLIKVRNHPEYVVEGRKSYIAPGAAQ